MASGVETSPPQSATAFRFPSSFPPGVNPETYKLEEVTRLLKKAAYVSIYSVPRSGLKNQPTYLIPGIPFLITSVNVNEELHRFDIRMERGEGKFVAHERAGE